MPHRKNLTRIEDGSIRFLTFSCFGRQPLLELDIARQIFLDHLSWLATKGAIDLHAYVLMLEHVHLLLTPREPHPVPRILENLKSRTASKINAHLRRRGTFWLPGGGYDRNIVTRAEFAEKLRYIHENPARRGLPPDRAPWLRSSLAAYHGEPYLGQSSRPWTPTSRGRRTARRSLMSA